MKKKVSMPNLPGSSKMMMPAKATKAMPKATKSAIKKSAKKPKY